MDQHTVLTHGNLQIPILTHEPDYSTGSRVLIALHGFGGNMHSSVIGAIAEEMSFYNTHTITFDFPAHGESPMHDTDLTLDTCQDCLLTVADYAVARGADVIVRGVRNATDFDVEYQLALINRSIYPQLETMMLPASAEYQHFSSSMAREMIRYHQPLEKYLPAAILPLVREIRKEEK